MLAQSERSIYPRSEHTVEERALLNNLRVLALHAARDLFDIENTWRDLGHIGGGLYNALQGTFYMPYIASRLYKEPFAVQEKYLALIFGNPESGFPNGHDLANFFATLNTIPAETVDQDQLLGMANKLSIDEKGLGVVITDKATAKLAEPERALYWRASREFAKDIVGVVVNKSYVQFKPLDFRSLRESAQVRAGYIVVRDLLWSTLAS